MHAWDDEILNEKSDSGLLLDHAHEIAPCFSYHLSLGLEALPTK